MRNIEALEAIVGEWVGARTVEEAGSALTKAGIPWGPVSTIADVVASPQIAAREMMLDVEHPTLGTSKLPGIPVKLSESPGAVRKAPPLVGEDNERIYRRYARLFSSADRGAQGRRRDLIQLRKIDKAPRMAQEETLEASISGSVRSPRSRAETRRSTRFDIPLELLRMPKTGTAYDLSSGWWPGMPLATGHPPFHVMTYRSPAGRAKPERPALP